MDNAIAPRPPRVERQRFETDPTEVGEARRFVRECVGRGHPRCYEAELLTSEIMTNALAHTDSSGIGVEVVVVTYDDSMLRVSVLDAGGKTVPCIQRNPGALRGNGRGLAIVDETADEWGFHRLSNGGGEVWYVLRPAEVAHSR